VPSKVGFAVSTRQKLRAISSLVSSGGEFTNVKQLFRQRFDARVNKLLLNRILCPQTFLQLPHRNWRVPNIGAFKSCLASTQHNGESEQDFTA
jgi:hypothetical protein